MNLNFKQQSVGETVYLVLDMDDGISVGSENGTDDFKIDAFAVNMMTYNKIANIVQVQIIRIDEKRQFQFNITGLAKLNSRISVPRPKSEVLGILSSILNAFEEVDAYMLDMDHLLLDWEYIYLDGQGNCMLMYLPFNHGFHKDKIVFLQEIVSRIQPDYQEKDPYLFDIMNAFSRGAIQKLSDFREILKKSVNTVKDVEMEEKREEITEPDPAPARANPKGEENIIPGEIEKKTVKKTPVSQRMPVINIPGKGTREKEEVKLPPQEKKKEKKKFLSIPGRKNVKETVKSEKEKKGMPEQKENSVPVADRKSGMYEDYEMTVMIKEPGFVSGKEEGTIMLEQPEFLGSLRVGLIRKKDGMFYQMDGYRTVIGSGPAANICIHDNGAISRIHATITCENGIYYIEDNQSKNGSFIDECRLRTGIRRQLSDGMVIRLANEVFEFSKD